ncbi:hypothetical protein ABQX22_16755 [Xanthomonas sp. WHRI 1810A]|uniref:hypothetical protein n=1 Tax=Xanthomonas sp. WHRI 1810A TaxID=3161565 RepID=UPI0032E87A65
MLTIYSDDHHLHHGRCELIDGKLMPCFEMPSRADHVLQRVKDRDLGEVQAPQDFGLTPIQRVHTQAYLEFFKGAWERWAQTEPEGDLLPYTWPARTLRSVIPKSLHGQLGHYSFDAGAPITAGTWQAAYSAAQVALTAQAAIQKGARSAFALCRPPGHHAAGDVMGGYCYLNNAAIAAQAFIDQGHLLQPKVIAPISDFVGYPNPNKDATDLVDPAIRNNPNLYPTEAAMKTLYTLTPLPRDAERARTRVWTKIKSGT